LGTPPPPHEAPPEHAQLTVPPHRSESPVPHAPPRHGLTGVQPQWLATPPPAQVFGAVHVPHETIAPQLLATEPQSLPLTVHASLFATHAHTDGDPTHDALAAHGVH
jgi:hypothetical protein